MGRALFTVITVVCLIQVLRLKNEGKLIWLYAAILFLPHHISILENPIQLSAVNLIIFALTLQLLMSSELRSEFLGFPLKTALIFIFVCFLGIAFFDSTGISVFQKIWRFSSVFFPQIFIIFIAYFYTRSYKGFLLQLNSLMGFFLVFCLYGLLNYFTHNNAYNDFISKTYGNLDIVNMAMAFDIGRFRISSFVDNPILYGLYLGLAILVALFLFYFSGLKAKVFYLFLLFLLAVNLVLVDTRTPIAALALGIFVFILFGVSLKRKILICFASFFLFCAFLLFSPKVNNILASTYDTFTGKKTQVEGSSFSMREIQLKGSLEVFHQKPLTGNGFFYASDILPNIVVPNFDSTDFFGLESYVYRVLIEEGVLGIIGNLFFFGALFFFFLKRMRREGDVVKKVAILSVCLLLTYLFFIIGTGDLDSFSFFMAIMGLNIKGVVKAQYLEQNLQKSSISTDSNNVLGAIVS